MILLCNKFSSIVLQQKNYTRTGRTFFMSIQAITQPNLHRYTFYRIILFFGEIWVCVWVVFQYMKKPLKKPTNVGKYFWHLFLLLPKGISVCVRDFVCVFERIFFIQFHSRIIASYCSLFHFLLETKTPRAGVFFLNDIKIFQMNIQFVSSTFIQSLVKPQNSIELQQKHADGTDKSSK